MAERQIGSLQSITDRIGNIVRNPVDAAKQTFSNYASEVKNIGQMNPIAGAGRAIAPIVSGALSNIMGPAGVAFGALQLLGGDQATPYETSGSPVTGVTLGPGGMHFLSSPGTPGGGQYVNQETFDKMSKTPGLFGPKGTNITVTDQQGNVSYKVIGDQGFEEASAPIGEGEPDLDPVGAMDSTQTSYLLGLRESDDLDSQNLYDKITSAPKDQQASLVSQSMQDGGADSGDSKVICAELYRQKLIPEEWYKADQRAGQKFWKEDPAVMIGYLSWGIPVAKAMLKSKIITFFAKILARSWAKEMYAQEGKPELSTFFGRLVCNYGPRICRVIGNGKSENKKSCSS